MRRSATISAMAILLALNGNAPAAGGSRSGGEIATAPIGAESVTVRTVDFRGRPPFVRRQETVPVVNVAKLEVVPEQSVMTDRAQQVVVRSVDFRGRPPFARDREVLTVVPIARFEALDGDSPRVQRTRDFSGKPPFRRTLP